MVKMIVGMLVVTLGASVLAETPERASLAEADRVHPAAALARVDPGRHIDIAEVAALEAYWQIVPTEESLRLELQRLAREIQPPERFLALQAALGDDPVLIAEYLARPSLVLRLSRDLYAFDTAIHADTRSRAIELREKLASGELSPWAAHPSRSVLDLPSRPGPKAGSVLPLREEREAFAIDVVLSVWADGARVARYVVPKVTFEAWRGMTTVASSGRPDQFAFCAVQGRAVAVTAETDSPVNAVVLDASGEPLPEDDGVIRAPYTGLYYAQVARDAGDYLLSIDAGGRDTLEDLADLSVSTTDAPEPAVAGGLLTYSVVVRNTGRDAALDTEVLARLPLVSTFQSVTGPIGAGAWACTKPAVGGRGKVSCTIKCFGPGSTATFEITVKIDPCVGSSTLNCPISASSTTSDVNPANDAVDEQTPVLDPGTCDDATVCTSGDTCGPGIGYQEEFDGVSAPSLPAGWTTALVVGPPGARAWRSVATSASTPPNSMFAPDAPDIRDAVLDSPEIPIVSPNAQLSFRNRYSLERDQDGGVLEIKLGDGPFLDILQAGGSFVEGGYNGTISLQFGSPIAGREAWTNVSNGFVPTTVNLPAAAAGQNIVIRFRLATDRLLGYVGQWIDSVAITGQNVCRPGPPLDCDDEDACTVDACDAVSGCGHEVIPCDDGNPCTDDTCNPSLQCVNTFNSSPCDDHDACTLTDACSAGACVGSTAVACNDADVCTADTCDPALRCVATSANFDTTGFSAGRVDGSDLTVLADAWNSCVGNPRYNAAADLDRRGGCVDDADFHFFMNSFARDCPP